MDNNHSGKQSSNYINLLDNAKELFWKHGFKRVSIEEICAKSKISKMTFYRLFKNKLDIAKAIFDREIERSQLKFRELMESEELSAAEKIKKMIQMKSDGTYDISNEFLGDFYANPEIGLKDYIESQTWKAWEKGISDFEEAQSKGIFRKDFKPALLFRMAQNILPLIKDHHLIGLYDNPTELIVDITNLMVYGIVNHD